MRRRFGGYCIDARKYQRILRIDGLVQTTTILKGNIEIGLEIDPYSWRGDWLRDFLFGKGSATKWRLINVENHMLPTCHWDEDHGESMDRNVVVAVWAKADENGYYNI